MGSGLQHLVLDPSALAALAALLLAAFAGAAVPGGRGHPPPDTTARQDLRLARHRLAAARALLDEPPAGAAGEQPTVAVPTAVVEAQLREAVRQIRGARGKPGWLELPADRTAALDRALPDLEQAVAILRHHGDGDTRRRLCAVLETLHGVLDRLEPAE
ncbi:hypothetical protein [Azospirillum sp. ST 5-10]|uniref:hypothetical protein n=1 Tax=unclassified Azospirillum TaxID=2630922 RepID=UPI003F49E7BB